MSDEPNPYAAPDSDTNPMAEPPAKRTAWKIYALAVLVMQGVGFVTGLRDMGRTEVADFAMTTVGVVGLLGFAFRRRVLVRAVWQVWSIVLPLWDAALGVWVYPSHATTPKPGWTTAYLMAMVLFIPEYLALLWYAYRSPEIWRQGARS